MDWDSVSPFWQMLIGAGISAVTGAIISAGIALWDARQGKQALRTELEAVTKEMRAETTELRAGISALRSTARLLQDQGSELRGLNHLIINILERGGLIETVRRNDRGEPVPAQTHTISATGRTTLDAAAARLTSAPKASGSAQDGTEFEDG